MQNLQGEKSTQANVSFSQAGRFQHHLATHNTTASVQPSERPLTKDTTTCPGCFATNQKGERCCKGNSFPFLTGASAKKITELKSKGGKPCGRRVTDKEEQEKPKDIHPSLRSCPSPWIKMSSVKVNKLHKRGT